MNKRESCKINGLKYPSADKITSRDSTVARSMASTVIPKKSCDPDTERMIVNILGQEQDKPTCVYCGRPATHLDHLHPLVRDQFPTGYCSDPYNLVPCCKDCNRNKRSLEWEKYMNDPQYSTNTDGKLQERIERLRQFTEKCPAKHIDFNAIEGFKDDWNEAYNNVKEALAHAADVLERYKSKLTQ